VRGVAEAISVAKKEMKGTWLSYFLNGLLVLFLGLLGAMSVSGVFELKGFGAVGERMEEYYNTFFTDYLFLMVCAFLGVNVVSKDCMAPLVRDGWRGTFSLWELPVLRRLPLSAGSMVGSRLIFMLVALAFNAIVFFVVVYSFSDLGDLGRSYLWFTGIWLGYSLLAAGLYLASELTLTRSGKAHVLLSSFVFAASLMVFVALLEWALEPTLVEMTAKLAESHGAPAAIFSILAGGANLVLLSRLTARRIQKRGLSA
jgi:hypothetical protein